MEKTKKLENVALRCELSLSRRKYLADHLSRTSGRPFKHSIFLLLLSFFFEMLLSFSHRFFLGLFSIFLGTGSQTLYFAVKFYAVDPCKLVEELTR